MYSVIESGGFQHKVTLGETLKVSLLNAEVGAEVNLDQVLLFSDGKDVQVGTPHVADSYVKAEILAHGKGDKVVVFKRKRRKGYRRTKGHRQLYSEIIVTEITAPGQSAKVEGKVVDRARARIVALAALKAPKVKATAIAPVSGEEE